MTREVKEWYENSDSSIIIGEMGKNANLTSGIKGNTEVLLAIAIAVTVKVLAHSKMSIDEYCCILKDAYRMKAEGFFDDKSR